MTDLNINAAVLTHGVHFRKAHDDLLKVECNWCDSGDFVFYEGLRYRITTTDWIVKAVTHIVKYHQEEIKKYS